MNDYNSLLSDQEIAILREKKDWKTTMTIISMWAQVLFAFSLFIYLPNVLTFIISSVIVAAKQFQMTVLMHDGAHGLMYKNRKLNDFASQWFCAFPVMTDTFPYRKIHSQHHKYTETDKDPDIGLTKAFPTSRASLIRKFTRDLTGVAGLRRYFGALKSAWGSNLSLSEHISRFLSKMHGFLLTNLILFTILYLSGNPWLYLFLWWVPMITLFSLFYRIRSITEHSGVEGGDDFKNTRTTKVPWYLSYFLAPLNVNYHVEHHLFTFCPWYNLPMAHKMLKARGHTSKMEIANGYGEVFKKVLTAN